MIKNLIRKGTITTIYNQFGIIRAQVVVLVPEEPEDVVLWLPYGINSCPPIGSQVIIVSVFGNLEDKFAFPANIAGAPVLEIGETILYNNFGSSIYLKKDGDIEIRATKDLKITATKTDITSPTNIIENDLSISTIGKGLKIAEGLNAKIGTAILVAGTVTIPNISVTANSKIFVTAQTALGTEYGAVRISAKVPSTSFTITSYQGFNTTNIAVGDISTVAWQIIEGII